MAAPNPNFYSMTPLQMPILNKLNGLPLTGGEIMFYKDIERTIPKNVYKQVQLPDNTYEFSNVGSIVSLGSSGSPVDEDGVDFIPFLYPFENHPENESTGAIDLYFIQVFSSSGVLQFTREAWPTNVVNDDNPTDLFNSTDNQISNSQFIDIYFPPSGNTYSVSGASVVTSIAPDWDIVTDGTGTVTVKQIAPINTAIPTSPPYVLDISSTGISSLKIKQTFVNSPRLFANQFVCGTFIAASVDGVPHTFIMRYVPSSGDSYDILTATTTNDNQFNEFINTIPIDGIINTDPATIGNLNIEINIPVSANVRISSIQITNVQNSTSLNPFLDQSKSRQVDNLFHYYKPLIENKRTRNYLVGWDFPLNPAQPLTSDVVTQSVGAQKSFYVWDKTICFQTINNSIFFLRDPLTLGLKATATIDTSFALIQYIPAPMARDLLSGRQNIKLKGYCESGTINGTVSLYWTTDSIVPFINDSLVSSISLGVPSVGGGSPHGNWSIISRKGLTNTPSFTFETTNSEFNFTGFDTSATSASTTATYMAIVICFDTLVADSSVSVQYCSLNSGDICNPPSPQTSDEVLRECRYEYEKTYNLDVAPGEIDYSNAVFKDAGQVGPATPGIGLFLKSFQHEFMEIKRSSNPIITFYSPQSGYKDYIQAGILKDNLYPATVSGANPNDYSFLGIYTPNINGSSPQNTTGQSKVNYSCINTSTAQCVISAVEASHVEAYISYHVVVDARLGIV